MVLSEAGVVQPAVSKDARGLKTRSRTKEFRDDRVFFRFSVRFLEEIVDMFAEQFRLSFGDGIRKTRLR